MQIDLSARSVELLHSLTADGSDPSEVVEAAISYLVQQRSQADQLYCIDPATGRELSGEELRAEIQQGIDDIDAGRVVELSSDDALHAFFEDVKLQGRERLGTKGEQPEERKS